MKIKIFVFNIISVNTFILYDDTHEAVIIDCGCLKADEQTALTDFIKDNKLIVKHLLNTHLHMDHAFGNTFAAQTFGLQPEGNRLDETELPPLQQQAARFGIQINDPAIPFGSYLDDGDTVSFGLNTLHCLHVPGHSPGSLAFYSPEAACVFSGDVLFQGSIGRTDLWGGDFNTLIAGIRNKLLTLPDHTTVYPGHGSPTTIGEEKRFNRYLR
ncbi:MAG: MBL fold metallo-hydrolase [Dysgonamonadaceae bacterium]|jgi:glyoxylase-like metal-dependent hydrolase (beta-lactamase superfamily II)|nr:MBL fold metallo-hydrolase [Dysgonamonadaceae bacterium]